MVSSWGSHFMFSIGNEKVEYGGNSSNQNPFPSSRNEEFNQLHPFTENIPVSFASIAAYCGSVNISVKCQLTDEAKEQWQLETFNAIITAYEARLAEYNDKVTNVKAIQKERAKTNPYV